MADQNQSGQDPSYGDVADELRRLGKNLKDALQSAWESDERKRLEEEIRAGLADLGVTLNEAADEFKQSDTGKQFKEDVADFRRRVHNGEVSTKIHDELIHALRIANIELSKMSNKRAGSAGQTTDQTTNSKEGGGSGDEFQA